MLVTGYRVPGQMQCIEKAEKLRNYRTLHVDQCNILSSTPNAPLLPDSFNSTSNYLLQIFHMAFFFSRCSVLIVHATKRFQSGLQNEEYMISILFNFCFFKYMGSSLYDSYYTYQIIWQKLVQWEIWVCWSI